MSEKEITTILGAGAAFEGKLTYDGAVRIDGRFSGEILTEGTLVVGPGAEVRATVRAGSVVVEGQVVGDVHASKSLDLRSGARLVGNLTTPSLSVERGAVLDGHCRMQPDGAGRGVLREITPDTRAT